MLWKLQPIQIPPEVIFYIGPLPVTNALLGTWISIIALLLVFYFGTRRRDLIPSGMQNAVEWMIEYLLNLTEGVSGKVKARKFFPLVATFFIFILFCNLLDIFPGVDTIGTVNLEALRLSRLSPPTTIFLLGQYSDKLTPWVRPGTSDLNLTLALALVSVIVTQVLGFMALGAKQQLSKYFNFKAFRHGFQGPIEFFVGLIELVTELSRILSFSFRLFGNIFAGSAVLAVFAWLLPFVSDAIFIPLEIFVGFVQALIFALLTLVFLEIGTTSHEEAGDESEKHAMEEYRESEAEKETVAAS
ncbi:MAG TPA: F0F1 ATP synthase subunit A [Ktedonobacteraceae bacterium]|nr:F0F1 ATP synthase subunit A [Ktedonobacteraceae bacterium]